MELYTEKTKSPDLDVKSVVDDLIKRYQQASEQLLNRLIKDKEEYGY